MGFDDAVFLDREGFCIYGWQVEPKSSDKRVLWSHTVFMEVPAFTNYKTGDSKQTCLGRYTATKATTSQEIIFCEFKD